MYLFWNIVRQLHELKNVKAFRLPGSTGLVVLSLSVDTIAFQWTILVKIYKPSFLPIAILIRGIGFGRLCLWNGFQAAF